MVLAEGVRNPHQVRNTPTVIVSRDNGATIDTRLINPNEAQLHSAIMKSITNSDNGSGGNQGGVTNYNGANIFSFKNLLIGFVIYQGAKRIL